MPHDCYEQTHAIDWQAINSTIRGFRQNIRDGHQTTLLFNHAEGRLTLTCESNEGFVGTGVVSREQHKEEA